MVSNATHVLVAGKACGTDETGLCSDPPAEANIPVSELDYSETGTCFSTTDFSATADACSALAFAADVPLVASSTFASTTVQTTQKTSLSFAGLADVPGFGL